MKESSNSNDFFFFGNISHLKQVGITDFMLTFILFILCFSFNLLSNENRFFFMHGVLLFEDEATIRQDV